MPGDTFTPGSSELSALDRCRAFPESDFADLLRISPRKFLASCFEGMTAGPGRVDLASVDSTRCGSGP